MKIGSSVSRIFFSGDWRCSCPGRGGAGLSSTSENTVAALVAALVPQALKAASMATFFSVVNDNDFWVFLGIVGDKFGRGRGQRLLRLIQNGIGHKYGHGRRNKS